jgi:hypothetical protein
MMFTVVFVMALAFMCLFGPTAALAQSSFIPEKGLALFSQFAVVTEQIMPGFGKPQFFAAQGEHESCVSLKSKRCMDPTSELKTAREQGVGISQLTRTFRPDGTVRFDMVANLRQAYPQYLKDLNWDNIKERPDLQIKAQALLFKENYEAFAMVKDDYERIAMAAAGYNGGPRDIQKSRYMCGLTKGCDPQKWFANTERYCVKSKDALYGSRSACDINVHYPADILQSRVPKYESKFVDMGYSVVGIRM